MTREISPRPWDGRWPGCWRSLPSRHCASTEAREAVWAATDRGPSRRYRGAPLCRRLQQIGDCPTGGHQQSLGAAIPWG
jgi:hypothetical protein